MFRLDTKTALVTGASQGIGETIARAELDSYLDRYLSVRGSYRLARRLPRQRGS